MVKEIGDFTVPKTKEGNPGGWEASNGAGRRLKMMY